jgi:hypothetical protein
LKILSGARVRSVSGTTPVSAQNRMLRSGRRVRSEQWFF